MGGAGGARRELRIGRQMKHRHKDGYFRLHREILKAHKAAGTWEPAGCDQNDIWGLCGKFCVTKDLEMEFFPKMTGD